MHLSVAWLAPRLILERSTARKRGYSARASAPCGRTLLPSLTSSAAFLYNSAHHRSQNPQYSPSIPNSQFIHSGGLDGKRVIGKDPWKRKCKRPKGHSSSHG